VTVDFLVTPHLWEMYATPDRSVQLNRNGGKSLRRYRQLLTSAGGAIALILISPELQARIFPDAGTAYIAPPAGYNVNIRSGPGTRYPAVNTLAPGTPVTTTGFYEYGWAQLSDRNWVAGNLIDSHPRHLGQGVATTAYIAPPAGYHVNIRRGPGVRYPAVNTLAAGTQITITGYYEQGWAQLTDGTWVAGNLIRVGSSVTRPPTPPPQPPPTNNDILRVGTRSPEVVRLETRLRELRYVTPDFPADDYYGTDTAQAVRNFQRRNGLLVDGVAGPQTRNVMYSATAIPNETVNPPTPPPNVLRVGDRGPAVLELEIRLQDLGYFRGEIADSYFGSTTEQAVRNFQQRNSLPVNGVADARTQEVLYSEGAIADESSQPPTTPDKPEIPGQPPDLGNFRDVQVSTPDGQSAIIFSGPGTEFDLVEFIDNGATVTITGKVDGNWSQLDDGNWIYTDFLNLESSP
jgi:peptidoglycan hydrolase-like protein with peptidoglycan-binding domain